MDKYRLQIMSWGPFAESRNDSIMVSMSEGKLLAKLAMPMIFSALVSSLCNIIYSIFDRHGIFGN